jgi:glycosyltransferase involved in cell wall biosynthesis
MPRPDLIVSNRELGGFLGRLPRIHVYHGTMVGHTLGSAGGLPRRERARRIVGFGAAELLAGLGAVRVGVSESTAEEVHRYYRLDTHRVIPNAVDLDLFKPRDRMQSRRELGLPDGGRYALFVGRADRTKGADVLAPACRAAGWELLVAGCTLDGATSLGVLQPDRLAFAYTAADAVVFPTHYEACSFVVLEALASGTSLVTTEVGWMRTFLRNMPEYRRLTVAPTALDTARGLRAAETIDPGLTVRAREWIERHCALEDFADAWGRLADEVASGSRVRRGVRG